MEERSGDAAAPAQHKPPTVAELAGRFKGSTATTASAGKEEIRVCPPIRKKPPSTLNLKSHHPAREDLGHNGEEKAGDGKSLPLPKPKSKCSPGIGKLQNSLNFDPAAMLPGVSPKSPGLKFAPHPFTSPPSTPSSPPSVLSRSSESDEAPVSFEKPPDGAPLQSVNKGRTRVSMKRRPPSRKLRRSQTDDTADAGMPDIKGKTDHNGEKVAGNEEDVFMAQEDQPGSLPPQEQPSTEETSVTKAPVEGHQKELPEDSAVSSEEGTKEEEKEPLEEMHEDDNSEQGGILACKEEKTDEKASEAQVAVCQETTESNKTVNSEALASEQNTSNTADECKLLNEQKDSEQKSPDVKDTPTQDTGN